MLNHWRRVTEEGKDYPYSRFNKKLEILSYTDDEYRVSDIGSSLPRDHYTYNSYACKMLGGVRMKRTIYLSSASTSYII